MSINPYEATAHSTASASQELTGIGKQYWYRSTKTLSLFVIGMICISAFCTLVVGAADVAGYLMVTGYATGEYELEGTALVISGIMLAGGVSGLLIYLVSGIVFLVWSYRSTGNAHALTERGMEVTPGWAVGYWFIPILNLFRPYQSTCEIYRASSTQNISHWTANRVPAFVPWWWFCWIVGNILSRVEARAAFSGWDLGEAALPLTITTTVLELIAAALVIGVVYTITTNQEQKRAMLETPAAGHINTSSMTLP